MEVLWDEQNLSIPEAVRRGHVYNYNYNDKGTMQSQTGSKHWPVFFVLAAPGRLGVRGPHPEEPEGEQPQRRHPISHQRSPCATQSYLDGIVLDRQTFYFMYNKMSEFKADLSYQELAYKLYR